MCNILYHEQGVYYVSDRMDKIVAFACESLVDSDKSIKDHSQSLTCCLTQIAVFFPLNGNMWKKLMDQLIHVIVRDEPLKETRIKLLTSVFKIIKPSAENSVYMSKIKPAIESWYGVSSLLRIVLEMFEIHETLVEKKHNY